MKLKRRSRLSTGEDYSHVFARPEVSRDACFRVLRRRNDRDYCRLGLAVSRKVCRDAVGRNRLKRVIRESFRLHQDSMAEQGGWDLVVLPNAQAATICNAELFESMQAHWRKMQAQPSNRADEPKRNKD